MLTIEQFVKTQRTLLELERETEGQQSKQLFDGQSGNALEKQGVCVTKLYPASVATGLYGRRIVTFTRDGLPEHSLSPGDIAGITHKDLTIICEGIVSKTCKDSICVAFDDVTDDLLQLNKVSVLKLTNNITYKRYESCLRKLEKCEDELAEKLICSEVRPLRVSSLVPRDIQIQFHNPDLNSGQQAAVTLSLTRSDIAMIHGPPGTGKTTTLVEVIRQHVDRGEHVLVCAPSNIAVDNLLVKLASTCTVVRVGHPARVNNQLHHYSLDALLKKRDEDDIIGDIRRDIDQIIDKSRCIRDKGSRVSARTGIKDLKKELKDREYKAAKEVLGNAQVVFSTLTSASKEGPLGKLGPGHFSLCAIDEASQALEVACWIGILNARKLVLAGDHCQLPPTIKSDKAAKGGLELTLMERLVNSLDDVDSVCAKLTEQYRMHELIMAWSGKELYNNTLTAHHTVAKHILADLPGVHTTDITTSPLCLIDTAGADLPECHVGVSRGNEGEAKIVVVYIEELIEAGLQQHHIGVITPYNLQIELIRAAIGGRYNEVEVCTVDGFQGREKEAIIISLVRSNDTGEIGFLAEPRRMNVAVTRARRHVCILGNSLTVARDPFLGRMMTYFKSHALIRSAFEYDVGNTADIIEVQHVQDEILDTAPEPVTKQPLVSRDQTFKEKILKQLEEFSVSENEGELQYPGLNSYQRRIVHETCEEMGLFSMSQGSDRLLIVRRWAFPEPSPPEEALHVQREEDEVHTEASSEQIPEDPVPPKLVVCKQCGKRIPEPNLDLHLLHCKPKTFQSPHPNKNNEKKNLKNKKKASKQKTTASAADDDLHLLELAAQDRLICTLEECRNKTLSYMAPCQFCSRCYCTDHKFPESHGCGAAARKAAHQPSTSTSIKANAAAKTRSKAQLAEKGRDRTRKNKS